MKPILFNTDMVRAILEGRKTVTRRDPFQTPPDYDVLKGLYRDSKERLCALFQCGNDPTTEATYARYDRGDILWVRETFRIDYLSNIPGVGRVQYKDGTYMDIRFDAERYDMMRRAQRKPGWRPNENMPREAARIFLRVTGVRVERLQEITPQQAMAEGQPRCTGSITICGGSTSCQSCEGSFGNARQWFSEVWDSTIDPKDRAAYGWNANPWVWVIELQRISKEEDDHEK